MKQLIIYAIINLLASTLSGAAGGGAALISLPTLLLLGLSPTTAIASSKFSGLGMSAGTSLRFYKEKLTDRRQVIIFSLISSIGAVVGSLALVRLSDHEAFLEHLMGLAILVVGIPLLYVRGMGLKTQVRSRRLQAVGYVLIAASVIFQAALSSGLGSLQMVVMVGCFGMTALGRQCYPALYAAHGGDHQPYRLHLSRLRQLPLRSGRCRNLAHRRLHRRPHRCQERQQVHH